MPTIGRIVYYKARGSADGVFPKTDRAAIVTDVKQIEYAEGVSGTEPEGFQLRLCVMNPEGLFFTSWLTQGQEGGQWDWMPFQKDQQARLAPGTEVLRNDKGEVISAKDEAVSSK